MRFQWALARAAEDSDLGVEQAALLALHEQNAVTVQTEVEPACHGLSEKCEGHGSKDIAVIGPGANFEPK